MEALAAWRRLRIVAPAFPAFNVYSRVARHTTALGPLCVATSAARVPGWDVEVIDENNYRKFGPRDRSGQPDHAALQLIRRADAVGLYGGLSSTIPRLYELARFYKDQGATTIVGGQHFAGENISEALDRGADYVVIGEGEDAIQDLLIAIRDGGDPKDIPGIAFRKDGRVVRTPDRPPITDLDSRPLADFDLLRYAKVRIYPINWIRGCGMNCEFCTVKGRPRPVSVERIVEQVAALVETRNAREFFIVDDLFGQRREETLRLCRLLADYQSAIGVKLDFTVQIRLDCAKDAELLQAMRKASVVTVCIGFESPIPQELEAMNKRIVPEDMLAMTRRYHKAGFLVHGMFIFGYPLPEGARMNLSVRERVRHFRRFIRKARLDTIQVLLPVPLPGTALTERLAARGRIFPKDIVGWEYYDGNFPLFKPDPPATPEQMHKAVRRIMGRFYRFRHMFVVGLNVLVFPAMILSAFNIRFGWRRWYRLWRNALVRFGGWIVVKRWTAALKGGKFSEKLAEAKAHVSATVGTQRHGEGASLAEAPFDDAQDRQKARSRADS